MAFIENLIFEQKLDFATVCSSLLSIFSLFWCHKGLFSWEMGWNTFLESFPGNSLSFHLAQKLACTQTLWSFQSYNVWKSSKMSYYLNFHVKIDTLNLDGTGQKCLRFYERRDFIVSLTKFNFLILLMKSIFPLN